MSSVEWCVFYYIIVNVIGIYVRNLEKIIENNILYEVVWDVIGK